VPYFVSRARLDLSSASTSRAAPDLNLFLLFFGPFPLPILPPLPAPGLDDHAILVAASGLEMLLSPMPQRARSSPYFPLVSLVLTETLGREEVGPNLCKGEVLSRNPRRKSKIFFDVKSGHFQVHFCAKCQFVNFRRALASAGGGIKTTKARTPACLATDRPASSIHPPTGLLVLQVTSSAGQPGRTSK